MHGDANITGAASGAVLRVSERLWLPDKEYYVILLYLLALLTLARLSGQCNFALLRSVVMRTFIATSLMPVKAQSMNLFAIFLCNLT